MSWNPHPNCLGNQNLRLDRPGATEGKPNTTVLQKEHSNDTIRHDILLHIDPRLAWFSPEKLPLVAEGNKHRDPQSVITQSERPWKGSEREVSTKSFLSGFREV